jgi:hypothetical protein
MFGGVSVEMRLSGESERGARRRERRALRDEHREQRLLDRDERREQRRLDRQR